MNPMTRPLAFPCRTGLALVLAAVAAGAWLIVVGIASAGFALVEKGQKKNAGARIKVALSIPGECYKNWPCIAEIRTTNLSMKKLPTWEAIEKMSDEEQVAALRELLSADPFPQFDLLSPSPPATIDVSDSKGRPVKTLSGPHPDAFWIRHPAIFEHPKAAPRAFLPPTETQGFLIDLRPWLAHLGPGEYAVSVNLHSSEDGPRWKSNSMRIELKEFDAQNRQTIKMGLPARIDRSVSTPWDWVDPAMKVRFLKEKLAPEVFAALSPYAFLSATLKEGRAPLDLLDGFPDHVKPYGEVLRFEVLLAKGEKERAHAVRRQLQNRHPWLKEQLEKVRKGRGLIFQASQLVLERTRK
jgi:hypothetical protein